MGVNTGDSYRVGSQRNRSQFQLDSGCWAKRDTETGRILRVKIDGTPFKGVAREVDGRRRRR